MSRYWHSIANVNHLMLHFVCCLSSLRVLIFKTGILVYMYNEGFKTGGVLELPMFKRIKKGTKGCAFGTKLAKTLFICKLWASFGADLKKVKVFWC